MTTIDEIKVHWFCFSFSGVHAESGRDATACTYVGYSDSKITMPKINAQKIQSSLTENAILISVLFHNVKNRIKSYNSIDINMINNVISDLFVENKLNIFVYGDKTVNESKFHGILK